MLHSFLRRLHWRDHEGDGPYPRPDPPEAGIFGAEAWSEEMRQDIQKTLGIKAYDIYGLTELSGPGVSFECSAQRGMHINEDHFIAEIIDRTPARCCPRAARASWYSPPSQRRRFLCCATALGTSAPHPGKVSLRPHPCEDVQAQGPHRRHAHHPGGQRIPLPDRDGAPQLRLSRQLPDHRGSSTPPTPWTCRWR